MKNGLAMEELKNRIKPNVVAMASIGAIVLIVVAAMFYETNPEMVSGAVGLYLAGILGYGKDIINAPPPPNVPETTVNKILDKVPDYRAPSSQVSLE